MQIVPCVRQRTFSVEPFRYPLCERGASVEQPRQPKHSRRLKQHAERTSRSVAIAGQTVADILDCWPQTVPVFMHYRLACIGCALARFELITDVAAIYGINPAGFLHELEQAIEDGKSGESGCSLGEREEEPHEYLASGVESAILDSMTDVRSVNVHLTFDPPWDPAMMSGAAKHAVGW
ncbi:MAG: DUF1858 domain-containing protein [Chloroflexi bacterium]|nr:DUF1858 domain-containing protein [Chloroflexota bacterium]